MTEENSDMPFKVSRHKVVIFKDLPVSSVPDAESFCCLSRSQHRLKQCWKNPRLKQGWMCCDMLHDIAEV